MSDKVYFIPGGDTTTYVPYEKTVIEKRAPTDDSIRLYKEMKEKAEQSIIDSFKVENTLVQGRIVVARDAGIDYNNSLKVFFKIMINGHEFSDKIVCDMDLSREEIIEKVIGEMSTRIAKEVLSNAPNDQIAILMTKGMYL